jgi:hypothetical protein
MQYVYVNMNCLKIQELVPQMDATHLLIGSNFRYFFLFNGFCAPFLPYLKVFYMYFVIVQLNTFHFVTWMIVVNYVEGSTVQIKVMWKEKIVFL